MAAAAAAKKKKAMKAMKAATTMKSTAMKARDDAAKTKKMMETKKMMKTKKTTKAKKEEADAALIALKEAMKPRDSPNDPFEVRLTETRRILGVWRAFKDAHGPLYRSEHRLID